jgi:hypothetical protein
VARRVGRVGLVRVLVDNFPVRHPGGVTYPCADRDGDGDPRTSARAGLRARAGDRDCCTAASAGADHGGGAIRGEWSRDIPLAVGKHKLQSVHARRPNRGPL